MAQQLFFRCLNNKKTQGSNWHLLHWQTDSLLLSHLGSPLTFLIPVFQPLRHVWLFAAHQASLSFISCRSLFKLMSIESVMSSNHLIFCHPLLLLSSQEGCWESLPASGSFPVSRFPSGGQSIRASASASVLPMNIQGWFYLGLTGLISLQSKGLSRVFSRTIVWKHSLVLSIFMVQLISVHDYWKTIALTIWTFASEVMSPFFSMLSGFVIAFLPRSKHLLISWL